MLLVIPFVFYVSNAKSTRDHNAVDKVVVFVSAPVQWLVGWMLNGVSSVWHDYVALVGVQRDNDRLRLENETLKHDLAVREEQRRENERLRALLGLREQAPEVEMRFAQVIAVSPTPLFRSVRIDRGESDGVRLGAAVVTHQGVVGRVAALTASYADVMLLVDANSSTDVLVQRTRVRARVRGTGRDKRLGLQLEYLGRSADVEPGDVLITSGTGAVFPRGLQVGAVMAVERGAFGLYQQASVEPNVDFGRLESVLVVAGPWQPSTTFEQEPEQQPRAGGPILEAPGGVVAPEGGVGP